MRQKRQVFAIIRVDEFHDADTPIEHRVTVNEIVATQEIAEGEVDRLTRVNGDKRCRYYWQATRWVDLQEETGTRE